MMPNLRRTAAPPALTLNVVPPTFSGPQPIKVGRKVWGVPRGSRIAHPKEQAGLTYVLIVGRDVRLLCAAGEVIIPASLRRAIFDRYFGKPN